MGRNFYCEYCNKRMKDDLNVRKKHIDGLPHKIVKAEYMAVYSDPQTLLHQESCKAPCPRFHSGKECKFGLYCHLSHYTREQLEELSRIIEMEEHKRNSKNLEDLNETKRKQISALSLWKYPEQLIKETGLSLPPSLQPMTLEMVSSNFEEWS